MIDLDLFAGPGGIDVAVATVTGSSPTGVEIDPATCATRAAAGLPTIRQDVRTLDLRRLEGEVRLLAASPPCLDWTETKRRGDGAGAGLESVSGRLVLEPLRIALECRPRAIVLEQVPKVLPVWREIGRRLEAVGYAWSAAEVNAADYGVGQARRRAVLVASLDGPAPIPPPTHSSPSCPIDLFGLEEWRTLADVIGPPPYAVRWEEGAPYVEGDRLPAWGYRRPSTTVTSAGRIPRPGYRQHDERQFGAESLRLTVEQAARIQGFPEGFPWQGPARHRQIGNAVPPPLAAALVAAVLEPAEVRS